MMAKIGDQHILLHQHWPTDCCLCHRETEIADLRRHLADADSAIKADPAILDRLDQLEAENASRKLVLEETQRRAAQWVNERDWWRGRAERAEEVLKVTSQGKAI